MKSKLLAIQTELKSPKNQLNKFGGYNYRSCEDILEAVKPLLLKHDCHVTISDEIVEVGGRIYVKAIATFRDNKIDTHIITTAFAREAEIQKGMSEPQITGSASSYARKYALNGLFLIDDTKDADFHNDGKSEQKKEPVKKTKGNIVKALEAINSATNIQDLDKFCKFIDQNEWTEDEAKKLDFATSDKRSQLK